MFGKDFDASNSLNAEAMEILRGLLQQLRTKPASPEDWTKAASPRHWNLQQIAQAKRDVVAQYGGEFSAANLEQLDRDTILGFLKFQNNHHWYGLERLGDHVTKDMSTLRQTLTLLVDETVPIGTRLARIRPQTGPSMVKGLGRAVLTPILQVEYPERYGVLNNVTEKALKHLGLWPQDIENASEAEVYEVVNQLLLRLASELGTDLWTLDYLWWYYLEANIPPANDDPTKKVTPAVDSSFKSASQRGAISTPRSSSIPHPSRLVLPSGLDVSMEDAEARMLRFCQEEYDYYDRIPDMAPNRVEPIDVMVTIAMNSFVNNATIVRLVHRGLAVRCDAILYRIPVNADLLTFDPQLKEFEKLIHAAVQARQVLVPVATKVLHRKRRGFIPMLDNVVMGHYIDSALRPDLREKSQSKQTAAFVAVEVLKAFREDLRQGHPQIEAIRAQLLRAGFDLTPVRILEILVWTETEMNGYYRPR